MHPKRKVINELSKMSSMTAAERKRLMRQRRATFEGTPPCVLWSLSPHMVPE